MSRLAWYWHRLRAMNAAEIAQRVRKKFLQNIDARRSRDWTSVPLKLGRDYPRLPNPQSAPEALRAALRRDMEEILAGRWLAFGHVPIRVSDPPEWHKDYLAGVDLPTEASAFKLNHRLLPNGAEIKLIWELSRWYQLTRLALAAYVLNETKAAWKCVHWLGHWVQHNAPYRGWNWTSALESGMRLIRFTWIEALLQPFLSGGECESEFEQLRYDILPAHVWFTWRHKSFGSSANNHLLGELAGLIVATVRWPELAAWGAPLEELHRLWEREVLAQFAEDGGNREQALNYHLFSFEFCWHPRVALMAAGRNISGAVEERLERAREFFRAVHGGREAWDYGDSDDAYVLPLFTDETQAAREWNAWMSGEEDSAISYWIGQAPKPLLKSAVANDCSWRVYAQSGIAVAQCGDMFLRWDVSPLGYLATAAHGQLDALHLSIWVSDIGMIIDPGTGVYFINPELRNWLAGRGAHNGPCAEDWPHRAGPFLWSEHHAKPKIVHEGKRKVAGEFSSPNAVVTRSMEISDRGEVIVRDGMRATGKKQTFSVLWQFAPEAKCEVIAPRQFRVSRGTASLQVAGSTDWETADLVTTPPARTGGVSEGIVSPHYRVTMWAPYLKLTARTGHKPCVFTTTFLASRTP